MKKDVEIIKTDASLIRWLLKELDTLRNGDKAESAEEFENALRNLMAGRTNSLIIEAEASSFDVSQENCLSFRDLKIYPSAHKVVVNGKNIALTPKEFDILLFLARNRGTVFTKEQIYNAVWDEDYLMDDSNIMAFIRKIRKKIEPEPDAPQYLLTIWGIGYKFNDEL